MQKDSPTPVEIIEDDVPEVSRGRRQARRARPARSRAILTNDFNLNRVAELQGVRVLNINSLANAVKPAVLPGEELRVRVIQEGKEAGQGVGFLDDGTMIVVEGGARFIDRDLDVTVTRVLQTVAGRMIFAQPRSIERDRAGGRPRPTRSSSPPAARPGWAASTSWRVAIGGRPLLAWTLAALAAARESSGSSSSRRADGSTVSATAAWLPGVVGVVAGGARRQESVAAGFAASSTGRRRDGEDRVVLVHDGARPLGHAGAGRRRRRRGRSARRRDPGRARSPRRSSGSTGRVAGTVDRTTLSAAQTPAGRPRDAAPRPSSASRPTARETFTDEAALLEACRIPVHAVPGDPATSR